MPVVASMGGNAGTQSLTVAVRALATKDLTGANAPRVVRRDVKQLYSPKTGRFLADRYVVGGCYRCGFPEARGDAMLSASVGMTMPEGGKS